MNTTLVVIVVVGLGLLFFASAVYALWWSGKTGQFKKLEEGAKVVFTEDEPIDAVVDAFPKSKKELAKK